MRIVIGSDHAGVALKEDVAAYIRGLGHEVVDVGTHSTDPVDYPDYAEAVSTVLLDGSADRGVLICGSGVGASVAANKLPGIRAGLYHDTYSAHQGVEHDNMNVLVLGGRVIGPALAHELVTAYLTAEFTGEERHRQRLQKVAVLEERRNYPLTHARYQAILFDMDGVITDTASIHAACWKTMFDEYLQTWAKKTGQPFRPFDVATDYKLYVDGKPRYLGVRDFLQSRGITVPEGDPDDTVLRAAEIDDLFDARVDGVVIAEHGLAGKPSPDSFLKAAEMLEVTPRSAVVIEDAISGVQAGARGGFGLVIGVDRKGNAEELKRNGAHLVVRDVAELLTWDFGRLLEPAA